MWATGQFPFGRKFVILSAPSRVCQAKSIAETCPLEACSNGAARSAAAILATLSPNMKAAEHWICLTTPHFEMYTTNSEKQGTAALSVFEQVRYFFLQNSKSKTASDTPVRIIAFHSEKEYRPYRVNEGAFAYYVRSRKVDYIVMQDISSEHHQVALHEYTHLVIEHLGLQLPVWLNEGLADLYSSLEPKGDQALLGRPLPGHLVILMTQRWLNLDAVFAVGPKTRPTTTNVIRCPSFMHRAGR